MSKFMRWLLMVLPFVLWGTSMAVMNILLPTSGSFVLAWFRLVPAGLALILVLPILGRSWRIANTDRLWLLIFSLIDASLFQGMLAKGLQDTGAGLGSVLIDSQPLIVALLARTLFSESINPIGWLGLTLGLVGILLVGIPGPFLFQWWLQGPSVVPEGGISAGVIWMLGAALSMAIGTVISRYASRSSDPIAVTGWHMIIGGLPFVVLHRLNSSGGGFWPDWSLGQWGLMGYASFLGSALAYGLFFWFTKQEELTSFTSLTFLTPVFAIICGITFLGEQLTSLQWVGVGLALLSVVLVNQRRILWE
uniref:Putative SMR family transporter, possible pecM-like protein n=1 Tax=Paulinella chromatophora TaxID=39717 RepID=B1X5D0_PAUCH|nr:putative SMR family transporter, possible pecM- like protein [Paulinella chromatophora]ACB43149.1 putative SMR family transporter, possible pecM- like protein [Paulinella chromatophora]